MKSLIIALTLLIILPSFAQENTKGFEFHSISFSPLNVYFANRDGGFGMNIDLSFNKSDHIFKFYFGGATEYAITIWGEPIRDSYEEYNILYGKEFSIKKWFSIDLFAGAGFFNFRYDKGGSKSYKKGVIGFPLQGRIRFNPGRTFSLGIQLHGNVNSATTIYQPGIFLQWKL